MTRSGRLKQPAGAFSEFRRASVAVQAAAALRESIRQGAWGDLLPGEYELARRLCVSRPTIRAALARLADDGIITIRKGCRTRLCSTPRGNLAGAPPTVCLVVPSPRESQAFSGHPLLMEMRAEFAVQGIGWEEVFDRTLGGRHPENRLSSIVQGRHCVCWLLLGASATIQHWFQQAKVPTLVLGSCHAGVELPSVDVNYYAIGWHAAGFLTKNGHRRVALVLPHRLLAGDLACVHGLTEYIKQQDKEISVIEVTAGPSRVGFLASLNRLLLRAQPPTAIFCIHVAEVLTVLIHLLRSGKRVPGDVSLLCRETRPTIDLGVPELTRYRSPTAKQAHHAVRIAQSMLAGHHVPTKPHLIMPAFVPGETLARVGGLEPAAATGG
jgi:DNA-binding LacI/PurR family transcriptional regulator